MKTMVRRVVWVGVALVLALLFAVTAACGGGGSYGGSGGQLSAPGPGASAPMGGY